MSDRFDKLASELQASILEDARKTYSEKVIERWLNPANLGRLADPDGHARIQGPCGDTMEISLTVAEDRISGIRFLTDGCASSIAAGCMAAELAEGRRLEEALMIEPQTILDALDGLPEDSVHCALLASNTLKAAIRSCLDSSRSGAPDPQGSKP